MAANNSRNLRIRVRPYLDELKSRAITNREVAAQLGCNEATLCRVLSQLGFAKEPAIDRKALSDLNRERKRFRIATANDPANTPEQAAKICNVSVRTIYRYIGKTVDDLDGND